jgi:hypothetical protein
VNELPVHNFIFQHSHQQQQQDQEADQETDGWMK